MVLQLILMVKRFYVQLGNAATDWNATATTVTALNPTDKAVTDTQSDKVAVFFD